MATRAKKQEVIEETIDTTGWEEWPTIEELADELGCSRRTIFRKVKSGEVRRYVTPGGYRYKPEDVDRIGDLVEEDERKDIREANAALIEKMGGVIETLTNGSHRMTELMTDHVDRLMKSADKQLEQSHKRIESLEKKTIEMLELREEMLSELHARELASEEFKSQERRKDAAIETLKNQVAPVILAHMANRHPLQGKLQTVLEVLNGLDPNVWGLLVHPENDMLTAEQKEKLKELIPDNIKSTIISTPLGESPAGETQPETSEGKKTK